MVVAMVQEKRLEFRIDRNVKGTRIYEIFNKKEQYLGYIKKHRVGQFLHWCFFPDDVEEQGDLWFTNGCLKEITVFITKLYGGKGK